MTPENKMKRNFKFINEDLNFMLALLLGDGCLTSTGRLVVAHGKQQQDYCEWKAEKITQILNNLVTVRPTRQCVQLQFQRHDLCQYYYKIYINKKKRIMNILPFITNPLLAISLWLCDDGNVSPSITNNKCYSSAIQLFTFTDLEESLIIANWFEKHTNLRPNLIWMDRSKSNRLSAYKLRFTAPDSRKLFSLIKPYLPDIPSMQYKFRYLEYNLSTNAQQR